MGMREMPSSNDPLFDAVFYAENLEQWSPDCISDLNECNCGCHRKNGLVLHIMACCEQCDECKKLIKTRRMEYHKQEQHPSKEVGNV